jgi:hypothetical protein
MALDEITATVKKDKPILMVGSDILRNKGAEKGGGRRKLNDFLDPRHFDNLVECAKNLGGFSDEDGTLAKRKYKSPSQGLSAATF